MTPNPYVAALMLAAGALIASAHFPDARAQDTNTQDAPAQDADTQDARTFRHWSAECADALCVARTVTPGGTISLRILRENASGASWEIAIAGVQQDVKAGTPVEMSVDGSRPMRFTPEDYAIDGERLVLPDDESATALFATMLRGDQATLSFTHNSDVRLRLTFSLAGLGAATQWIEERQARDMTTGMERDTERDMAQDRPSGPPEGAPDHVPTRPDTPDDAAGSPEPAEVPQAVSRRHTQDGVCKDYDTGHMRASRVADKLDDHHSLYLLPCYAGAYNVTYRVWITDYRYPDAIEQSLFAGYSDEQGWYGADQLINAEYDPETKTLSALEKGRGAGGCGAAPEYRWSAAGWRMLEYRYWGDCDEAREAADWPVIFEHPEK